MPRTVTLNWIDWVILAIVLVSILRGSRFGIIAGLGDLAVLVGAFLAAGALYPGIAAWARRDLVPFPEAWAAFSAFLIIWIGLYLPVGWLVRWAVGGHVGAPLSRLLGGVLGGIRGLVLMTALLVVTLAGPFDQAIAVDAKRSWVVTSLLTANDWVEAVLLPTLPVSVPRLGPGGVRF